VIARPHAWRSCLCSGLDGQKGCRRRSFGRGRALHNQFEIAVADGKHQIPRNGPQDHLGGQLPPLEAVAPIHLPRRALFNRGPYTGNPATG
jgi:hypothetical protein